MIVRNEFVKGFRATLNLNLRELKAKKDRAYFL